MTLAGSNFAIDSKGRGALQLVSSEDIWKEQPPFNEESGSAFGWNDRLFYGYRDGLVFDYGDWMARDIEAMLKKGYKAKQIEMALSYPIMSAEHNVTPIKGDTGESDFLSAFWDADPMNGGSETSLSEIIELNTSAFSYKSAFWELVYAEGTGDFAGKTVYSDVAWRPQTTCRMAREVKTGKPRGFEQEAFYIGTNIGSSTQWPIYIPTNRAYVYLHGKRRDPLHGVSDLEIPYWCYKTTQKLLFLWFQFLEGVSLPRTVVKANDLAVANNIAKQVAQLRSSGVLPLAAPGGPTSVAIDTLDVSGKGADQFQQAIAWLDSAAVNSVLAGFLDLSGSAANGLRGGGGGSYALSRDASDFFLQSREADAREMERSIRDDLFGPLIRYNFGPNAKIPQFNFEPLNSEDKEQSVTMLTTLLGGQDPSLVPSEFISELAEQVGTYLGLDGSKIKVAFEKAATEFAAKQAANAKMAAKIGAPSADPNAPGVGVAPGAAPNSANAAKVAGAVSVAHKAVTGAMNDQLGKSMSDAQKTALSIITGKGTQL